MLSLRHMKTITNVVRSFSLSCCKRESTSTKTDPHLIEKSVSSKTSQRSTSIPYSFDECQRRMKEIKQNGEIDFDADGPIQSAWNRFPDDLDPTTNQLDGFDNKHRTQEKQHNQSHITRTSSTSNTHTTHIFLPGEIALFRYYSLRKKKRPVLILSSFNHNQNPNATLLIVPFTTKYPNSALYQWKIFPEETCHRSVVEKNSILIFDYSTLVEYEELEITLDSLKHDSFRATIQWWKQTVNSILPSIN